MPILVHKSIEPAGEIGIWSLVESEEHFLHRMDLISEERKMLGAIRSRSRRREWLASRMLLHEMSGRKTRGPCLKDEYGKPFLESSDWHISMSHSAGLAAVIASPHLVGVDIQRFVEKIGRIKNKFLNQDELDSISTDEEVWHLHAYWGAKECLYKAYGRKELDYKQHILLSPFEWTISKGMTTGMVCKGEVELKFDVHFEIIQDYMLVWAIERS